MIALLAGFIASCVSNQGADTQRPLIFAHVMPWFEVNNGKWGWHWRMNQDQATLAAAGKVASHFRPLLGPYDSADPAVVEAHLLWMKVAGFDGVLADWYGTQSHYDYPVIHKRTEVLFDAATKLGLKIGVIYEDQSVKNPLKNKLISEGDTVRIARETGKFLGLNWLKSSAWWKIDGAPVVGVFGPQFFDEFHWNAFREGTGQIRLLSLHKQDKSADGVYDWPVPSQGLKFNENFWNRTSGSRIRIPIAFPRFDDFYTQGGQSGYARIADNDGNTYRNLLRAALSVRPQAVQVATWNDWQEGTQVEPSVELMYRDLISTQKARKGIDSSFSYRESDFELVYRLYRLRKKGFDSGLLSSVSALIASGRTAEARKRLDETKLD